MADWTGFPPDRALRRLLAERGRETGSQAFPDAPRAGPERMAETLAAHGIQARVATLPVEDLRFLDLPTLIELADQSWVLLEACRRGRFRLRTPGGSLALGPDALAGAVTGRALDLAPAPAPGSSLGGRLWPLFLRHRGSLALAGAATLLLQLTALAGPAVTAAVMDRALPDGAGSLLGTVLAGLLLVTVHQAWIGWIRDRALLSVGARVAVPAGRGFLEHTLGCPFPFLQRRTLGELLQAAGGFAAARALLPARIAGFCLDGGMALVQLAALALLLPEAALPILAGTVLLAGATFLAGRAEAGLAARQAEAAARERGLLIELVTGIGALKGAGAEAAGLARWRRRSRQVLALELARGRIRLGCGLGIGLFSRGLAVGLFAYGGSRLLEGTLRAGQCFACLQFGTGFTASCLALAEAGLTLMALEPQLAGAREILAQESERPRPPAPAPPEAGVVMEDVWFRYAPSGPWVLEGYGLRVEPGAKRTLAGASGSGKTTVLRLLAGLHSAERGTVLVAGQAPRDLRHGILYLPQSVRIFGGSILDNLRLFSHGAEPERLMEAARRTGLQALVDTLPMGYRTLLTPGGRTLSGGQRQLIALTGALAADRPLMLLDEALASLDPLRAAPLRELLAAGPWTVVAADHFRAPGAG